MRTLPVEIQAEIAKRGGIKPRVLLWVKAKNRTTGEPETMGLWNGDDHQSFIVDGEERVYYAAGNILDVGLLTLESALHIRTFTVGLAATSPELDILLRQYEPKMAPVETHLAFFSPETNNLIAPPIRVFKGWGNKFKLVTPPKGGQGRATLELVGHTRLLTKKLPAKRSHENQKMRNDNDSFFIDVTMTGSVVTPWGSKGVGTANPAQRVQDTLKTLRILRSF